MKNNLLVILFLNASLFSVYSQTNYIQSTTDASLGNKVLLHSNELKIGNSTSATERAKNMIKIGDGSYIQIGEWEADDLLSFKASKYNFTSGNVGIGTTSPNAKLHIAGSVFIPSMSSYWIGSYGDSGNRLRLHHNGSNAYMDYCPSLYFRSGISEVTVFDSNGNVGIGTSNPTNKLDVNGTVRAKEVKIETGWADFVFNEDYNLRTLSEVNDFIKENKHLPEIPSITEVKENEGVNVGEMQVKLLQKIEELTLYLIRQNEKIQILESELSELKNK